MKLILAPMATLSHEAFRRTVEDFGGCDEYFTEMINAGSLLHLGPFEKFYLSGAPVPEKTVRQLTGSRADYMKLATKVITQNEGIGVDINMGCCAPQIANTGAGISWMTKPIQETALMIKEVKTELENSAKDGIKPLRLSVKLRLGAENFTKESLFTFTDMLISEGVEMLTLHPRTQKEKYREKPRWQYAEELALRYPKIPVILNGDIKDTKSYIEALKMAPHCAGIMIGRAASQKPWIFKEIKNNLLDNPEKIELNLEEIALNFINNVEQYQPEEFWKTRLQRFFAYYSLNMSFSHYFATQLTNAQNIQDSRNRLTEYFQKCPEDKIKIL